MVKQLNDKLLSLIKESIRLELNIADVYMLFLNIFPEDKGFWWQLCIEEKNHAALFKNVLINFTPRGIFPEKLFYPNLEKLKELNDEIKRLLVEYKQKPPSIEKALHSALKLETSTGELHFQQTIEKSSDPTIKIFQQLNKDDKNHADRIRNYMSTKGIE